MHQLRLALALSTLLYLLSSLSQAAPFSTNANRLAYLDEDNPFYPHRDFPRLTTPQWVGEPGVEAVVILAIDDMRDSKKYETYLRPILDRLKRMDGRAPVSIFANVVEPTDPQLQTWLAEGLSLEVHTLAHPCPLLQKGSFTNAWNTYHGGVDLLNKVPGNKPVAFRMPCCDSMNSPSPRFYSEIFNRTSPDGNFLQADSSVMCLLTDEFRMANGERRISQPDASRTKDSPLEIRPSTFRKYFPATTNALTKKSLANFGTFIEDYPYPYVINRTCWEFPAMVPSDWEAFNAHGPTNAATVADWQLALDAVVRAQGVFTFIFHPHGWIRSDQIVQFIDHAERTHGKKVKFLTFTEAVERLNKNLLGGQPLRGIAGQDRGVRVLDVDNDGFIDVMGRYRRQGGTFVWKAEEVAAIQPLTRVWNHNEQSWQTTIQPFSFVDERHYWTSIRPTDAAPFEPEFSRDFGFRLGVVRSDAFPIVMFPSDRRPLAWQFNGLKWHQTDEAWKGVPPEFSTGHRFAEDNGVWSQTTIDGLRLPHRDYRGVRLRDFDRDGRCELLVSNDKQNALFAWSDTERAWKKLPYALPPGLALVNERGEDNGLRFMDLNGDGFDDLLLSNEKEYAIYLWARDVKPHLGWHAGWSHKVLHEQRPRAGGLQPPSPPSATNHPSLITPHAKEIPPFVRSGPHRNNGAWFHRNQLFIQNEDTAHLPDVVWRKSFSELIAFDMPAPKSPAESQQCFQVRPGFRVELVAAEPLVMSAVAFEWGADGKLWVVEMGDYPNGVPRAGDLQSPSVASAGDLQSPSVASEPPTRRLQTAGTGTGGGRVKFLEDLDGDGIYDKATVFLDNLPFPTGVMPWRKGVLISAAPDILYAEDTDGDGKADVKRVLFTGFREGNQQHRVNGFELGLDNWIYGANGDSGGTITFVSTTADQVGQRVPPDPPTKDPAQAASPNQKDRRDALSYSTPPQTPDARPHPLRAPVSISGRDFRFRPDTGEFEAIEGQTQFGRRRDDWGNWFGNNNPNWLWHYWLPDRYLRRNPHLAVKSSKQMLANYPDSTRCYPISTPPIRFNQPQSVNHVTSGCSPAPYRDDLFGPGFATSVFISEPVHNLVHREVLVPDGVSFTSRRAPDEQDREFLASTDNWFRPTMLKTGPDGALYLADFYRFVLEHPEWIAPETQARLDLRAGADKGRIWRVVPVDQPLRKIPNLAKLNTTQLVAALDSPSGWQRDTAQRLLVERQDKGAVEELKKLAVEAKNPKVRVQALCVLEGLSEVHGEALLGALRDKEPSVRANAIRVTESFHSAIVSGQAKITFAVREGDYLERVAKIHDTTVEKVRALNKLTTDKLTVGQRLLVPVGSTDNWGISWVTQEFDSAVYGEEPRTKFQFALTSGDISFAGHGLANLLADTSDPRIQTAVMTSAPRHLDTLLRSTLDSHWISTRVGTATLLRLIDLSFAQNSETNLNVILQAVTKPQRSGAFLVWQREALARFIELLEGRKTSLTQFRDAANPEMKRAILSAEALFTESRGIATSNRLAFIFRQSAITLLGRGPSGRTEDLATLATLLKPQQPAEIQSAAVAQLAKLGGSDSASALLADWKAHSPALREAVLSALLSRPAWIDTLLAAIERGQVAPTQISLAQRQKLTTHPQAALRDRATKLFAATSADRAKVIKDYAVVATLTGSETRGRELFTKQCGVCHKLKGEGREIGPDLAMTATRDTDWLLTAILDPNAAVESRYLGYTAETKSGREFTGIITAETPNNLVMRGADGTEETILRTDLKQLLGSGLSLMPEGMESALKPQDMADLLAFIRAK